MLVTIIADASYCNETRVGGYGFWIAANRGKRAGGGPMEIRPDNNNIAEMVAIQQAVSAGLQQRLIEPKDKLIIQSDSLNAITAFEGSLPARINQDISIRSAFIEMVRANELTVEFRHVKGHTNNPGARFVTNKLCDKRAKDAMRQARQKFKALI